MMIRTFSKLRLVIASLAVAMLVASTSHATLTLSMPTVTVLEGSTTATAIIQVTSDVPNQLIASINPAISVSSAGQVGSAQISSPLTTGSVATSALSVPGSIWPASGTYGFTPPANPTLIKYNLTPASPISLTGTGAILELTFSLTNATAGDVYTLNFNADVNSNGTPDTTVNQPSPTTSGLLIPLAFNVVPGEIRVAAIPEPSSFALIGLVGGVAAVGNWYRKKRAAESTATAPEEAA